MGFFDQNRDMPAGALREVRSDFPAGHRQESRDVLGFTGGGADNDFFGAVLDDFIRNSRDDAERREAAMRLAAKLLGDFVADRNSPSAQLMTLLRMTKAAGHKVESPVADGLLASKIALHDLQQSQAVALAAAIRETLAKIPVRPLVEIVKTMEGEPVEEKNPMQWSLDGAKKRPKRRA